MSDNFQKILKRYPTDGTFELTVRCNLHCKMCLFRHDDSENEAIKAKELTAAQWIEIARQVAEQGTMGILLTGGEPMLRPDFEEIYRGIYELGFMITLYTNATLITPEVMKLLRECPPHRIGISIYGASPETYKKICGNPDAFNKMMSGVRELMTLPSVLDFRTTIIQDNYADARAIDELVHREFGKEYNVSQTRMVMKSVRGACADVDSCRLCPEDNVTLMFQRSMDAIRNIIGEGFKEENVRFKRIPKEPDPEDCGRGQDIRLTLFGCNAGMSSYTITWDGRLLGCQVLGAFSTDVISEGFEKAWRTYPFAVKHSLIPKECQNCKLADECQSCYGSRYAETGDINGFSEYVCENTKIKNKLFEEEEGKDEQKNL